MQAKNIQLLSRLLQEGPKSRRSKCIEREGGHDEAEHVRSVEVRLEKKEVNNANPQLPTKLNFLVCCVAGGRPPSPPERNVDGRGESSMKFFFFVRVMPSEPTLPVRGERILQVHSKPRKLRS